MTTTTLRLPPRIARLPQLRQIVRGGLAARGSVGVGLAAKAGGAAGFVGAYDAVPSIAAAYGMRRLLSSYSGSLLRIRRSSDSAEQDIGYTGAGDLDTAAVASFVGGGSGYIVNWYDQKNGCTATQATPANQPLYVANGQNGKPVGRFDGINDWLGCDYINSTSQYGIIGVVKSSVTKVWVSLSASVSQFVNGYHITPNKNRHNHKNGAQEVASGTWDTAASDGNCHARYIGHSGSTYEQSIDGAYISRTDTVAAFLPAWLTIGGQRTAAGVIALALSGDTAEIVICSAALSTANRQAAEAAANAYWAIY